MRLRHAVMLIAFVGASGAAQDGSAQDGVPHPLGKLHAAFGRARERPVLLSFYGASHTSGDEYTRVIRRALQRRFGDGGQGFVLPVSPFPFYARDGLQLAGGGFTGRSARGTTPRHDDYGLAGFALDATDRAHARVSLDSGQSSFTSVTTHFQRRDDGGTLVVSSSDRHVTASTATDRAPILLDLPAGEREVRLETDGPVRLFGVDLRRGSAGAVVDAFGVPGTHVWSQESWRSLEDHVAARPPDLVALAYGTNESAQARVPLDEYDRRLRRAVQRWQTIAPNASCLLIGPGDWPTRSSSGRYGPRVRLERINDLQRAAASSMGCAFFDTFAFMGGRGSMVRWMEFGLGLGDGVHLTQAGHERVGMALTEMLLRGYSGR